MLDCAFANIYTEISEVVVCCLIFIHTIYQKVGREQMIGENISNSLLLEPAGETVLQK